MELRKISGSLLLLVLLILGGAIDSHASFFNWGSCLRWRITGICRIVCHNYGCNVWVRVRHWRPDEVVGDRQYPRRFDLGRELPGNRRFDLRWHRLSDSLRSFSRWRRSQNRVRSDHE